MTTLGFILALFFEGFITLPLIFAAVALLGIPIFFVVMAFAPHRPMR